MSETRKLSLALVALVSLALVVCGAVWAQGKAQVTTVTSSVAVLDAPVGGWLARCSALPIVATEGLVIVKATVKSSRVATLVSKGRAFGWLQCHRLGEQDKRIVYACRGPTAMRDRMASDPSCAPDGIVLWKDVAALKDPLRKWIVDRSTCCGESSVGPAWPCAMPGVVVNRLDGYGPGVVGSENPCE